MAPLDRPAMIQIRDFLERFFSAVVSGPLKISNESKGVRCGRGSRGFVSGHNAKLEKTSDSVTSGR